MRHASMGPRWSRAEHKLCFALLCCAQRLSPLGNVAGSDADKLFLLAARSLLGNTFGLR